MFRRPHGSGKKKKKSSKKQGEEDRKEERYVEMELDNELFYIPERYELIETRGQGSYGVVVSARDKSPKVPVNIAIKKNKKVYPTYFPMKRPYKMKKWRVVRKKKAREPAADADAPVSDSDFEVEELVVAASSSEAEGLADREEEVPVIDERVSHRSAVSQKRILREFKILAHIGNHPNIVSLKDTMMPPSFEEFSDVYFVMDLMECDLKTIIESEQDLSEQHVRFFMYQVLIALHYIHSAHILHRDLKPENILINSDCELKLCDFGLARYLNPEDGMENSTSFIVSRWYRSPELLLCNAKVGTGALDMWSVGCIFAELMGKRQVLFRGANPVDQLQKIMMVVGTPSKSDIRATADSKDARRFMSNFRGIRRANFRRMFPRADVQAVDLLDKMVQFNPEKRPSAEDALRHPYFEPYFSEPDLAPNPVPFNHEFEELKDSFSLKKECYDAISQLYALRRKTQDSRLSKLKDKIVDIHRSMEMSPLPSPSQSQK